MPDLQLYTLVVPSASQSRLGNQQRQRLAQIGILDSDGGVAERLSSEPTDQTLNGVYRGRYAQKMALEVDELASASGFSSVALSGIGGQTPLDGYYAVEEATVEPAQAQTGRAQRYELSLTKKGTKNDHYRVVRTNPDTAINNPFGSDNRALVGVPSVAGKVQWIDPGTKERSIASATTTHTAELGTIAVYDLADAPYTDPWLAYEIDYQQEENVDVRVYDGRGAATKTDTDGNLEWAKCFSTARDWDGRSIIDNGLLRLELNEAAGTLQARRWSSGSWSRVDLTQPETVELFDVDFREISMTTARARLTFVVDGALEPLDAAVHRGLEDVLITTPPGESAPSQTLVDWLDPIASALTVDPGPEKDLLQRREL